MMEMSWPMRSRSRTSAAPTWSQPITRMFMKLPRCYKKYIISRSDRKAEEGFAIFGEASLNRRNEKKAFSEAASFFSVSTSRPFEGLKGASSPFLVDPVASA